jgi:peptidoglycan/xylan/chitin deacetylase (PgdA/CDA1 family)
LDDGPDPLQTPRALEVLDRHGSTATFFVLLTRVRRFPALLDEVMAGGHEIALHGPDHLPLTSFGFSAALRRTRDAKFELEERIGAPVRWFRPPYGSQTPTTWAATRRAGLSPVFWSATTWDWKPATAQERIAKALEGARSGTILLAHDGFAGAEDGVPASPPPLPDRMGLLDEVLSRYRDHDLACTGLSEALTQGSPILTAQFSVKQL